MEKLQIFGNDVGPQTKGSAALPIPSIPGSLHTQQRDAEQELGLTGIYGLLGTTPRYSHLPWDHK